MNVTPHDFLKPVPLSAVWEERLIAWTRQATVQANKAWAKELPIALEASVGDVRVQYAEQALAQVPEACFAYRVLITESKLLTLLIVPRRLMLNLVGVLLGESTPVEEEHEPTLIEANLGDYFLASHWLSAFRETWPGANVGAWILDGREPNPPCSRCFAPVDVLIALDWQIAGPGGKSGGTWLFPKRGLLRALGDADADGAPPPSEAVTAARRLSLVHALPLLVQVILGSTELSLSQLAQLQVGDLLMLDQDGADPIVRIGGRELFRGQVGRNGTSKAFQIKAVIES